jgi:transcriptional regulator with XRE-family HTH domain
MRRCVSTTAMQEPSNNDQRPAGNSAAGAAGIGERLRMARRARGLSQRKLEAAGVSFAYISRIERGRRIPSLEVIRRLAAALDVSPRWLETGDDSRWDGLTHAELATIHVTLLNSGGPASLRLAAEVATVLEWRAELELAADNDSSP